jgi:hypothetical protein
VSDILSRYNIHLTDLVNIYKNKIDVPLVNDLHKFSILGQIDKSFRKLFLHNVIFYVCQEIVETRCKEKIILYYCEKEFLQQKLNIFEHYNKHAINYELSNVFKIIKNKIPIRYFSSDTPMLELKSLLKDKNGKAVDVVNKIRHLSDKKVSYSFLKAKSFCNKNGLVFLVKEYFEKLKTKHLFIS